MWSARTAWTGERSDGSWEFGEVLGGGFKDAVVVDGGDVEVRGGLGLDLGLGQEEAWREEEGRGLRTEGAASGWHDEVRGGRVTRCATMCRCVKV